LCDDKVVGEIKLHKAALFLFKTPIICFSHSDIAYNLTVSSLPYWHNSVVTGLTRLETKAAYVTFRDVAINYEAYSLPGYSALLP
jgi:hypothetical protein